MKKKFEDNSISKGNCSEWRYNGMERVIPIQINLRQEHYIYK